METERVRKLVIDDGIYDGRRPYYIVADSILVHRLTEFTDLYEGAVILKESNYFDVDWNSIYREMVCLKDIGAMHV
jgi:hypothetical protein